MYVQKTKKKTVAAAKVSTFKKRIAANEETELETSGLLFEADDVAELLAEIFDEEITAEVSEDGSSVTFTIPDGEGGFEDFHVDAEGAGEIEEIEDLDEGEEGGESVKSSKTLPKASCLIKASTNRSTTGGGTGGASRTIRKLPRK